ncbi:PhnD/SsuA/transferrin family substrate-binding protein [Blastochloris tepida]|uniref:Phosphonate ABC transporter substrate-binding protein n=1 Tax=Blastochloris tepida TaxID=2233851 RepID=A0A348FYF7_9HYPH|nr:PhnD/SsuA/transferrin family substrate-binding protein [Blastochloris tepida]BBF92340.1 hypothetical protein BLTE_10250 [Blastochloris tepida]
MDSASRPGVGRAPSSGAGFCRRVIVRGVAACAAAALMPQPLAAQQRLVRFGLTPVFLTSDLDLLVALRAYLERAWDREVQLVTRRTYQEIMLLLVSGQIDAAWICGYPFVRHRESLDLVSVPMWRGQPLYQSYVIVGADRRASTFTDLEGDVHAFSDPDSNSGFLVTRALLADDRMRPETFFRRTVFTYGHRNVVRAVASGLAGSGSVDGYVYDVLANVEPDLVAGTRVLRRSEWLGFPPIAASRHRPSDLPSDALASAFLRMGAEQDGRRVLDLLKLDGFIPGDVALFDSIAAKLDHVRSAG